MHSYSNRSYKIVLLTGLLCAAASRVFAISSMVTCTLDSTSVSAGTGGFCGLEKLNQVYSSAYAGADAAGGLTGSIGDSLGVSVGTDQADSVLASASADASSLYHSTGPARLGNITISVIAYEHYEYGGATFLLDFTDGVHNYRFGCVDGNGCNYPTETVPFDLGSSFAVISEISGETAIQQGVGGFGFSFVDMNVSFKLSDRDGTPVNSILEGTPTPEPQTLGVVGIALLLGFCGCVPRPAAKSV